jgi:hypothetical protein
MVAFIGIAIYMIFIVPSCILGTHETDPRVYAPMMQPISIALALFSFFGCVDAATGVD